MNHKWTGTTAHTLEKHINRHQEVFVSLSEATNHIYHQIPKNCTRIGYLINSIDSKDAEVFSGLAAIRQDDQGIRGTFEQAAVFLAPTCPVAKKLATKGKISFDPSISATDSNQSGPGKTGMELRYHNQHEFLALPKYQRDELTAFDTTKDGGKWKGSSGKPSYKRKSGGKAGGNASTSNKKLK